VVRSVEVARAFSRFRRERAGLGADACFNSLAASALK